MLEKEVTSTSYCVELSIEEMLTLLGSDQVAWEEDEENLVEKLEEIDGVSEVEYNGHFGPAVYLTVDNGNDTSDTWVEIYSCIRHFINKE